MEEIPMPKIPEVMETDIGVYFGGKTLFEKTKPEQRTPDHLAYLKRLHTDYIERTLPAARQHVLDAEEEKLQFALNQLIAGQCAAAAIEREIALLEDLLEK
jgi:phosphosulfolactate synthase (CoM biosynthesis protein A)